MQIQSSRFGWLSVDDDRVITFPRGLLGFPEHTRFALLPGTAPAGAAAALPGSAAADVCFLWLQSADDPALAFVVADPALFFKDYAVPVRDDTTAELRVTDAGRLQVLVICNKVGDWVTGNLLGPLVVNGDNALAAQVVLTERKWTTRQPLVRVAAAAPALRKSA